MKLFTLGTVDVNYFGGPNFVKWCETIANSSKSLNY